MGRATHTCSTLVGSTARKTRQPTIVGRYEFTINYRNDNRRKWPGDVLEMDGTYFRVVTSATGSERDNIIAVWTTTSHANDIDEAERNHMYARVYFYVRRTDSGDEWTS